MVIEGILHVKYDPQAVSEKLTRREFVVKYADNPMYPQFIKFECVNDRCAIVDAVREGDKVEVTFNLKGREWINPQGEKKYFTSLEAWRMEKVAGDAKAAGRSVEQLAEESDDLFGGL